MSFHLALLEAELFIPNSQSLKDRRRVLKSLKDRVRSKFNVSIAETGHMDKWQRATISMCMLGNERAHIDKTLQHIVSLMETLAEAELTEYHTSYL